MSAPEPSGPDPGHPRVVVVDDEELVVALVSASLKRTGAVCSSFRSALNALEHLRSSPADLVVTDLRMPGLGGLELVERLRAESNPIPVILISGFPLDPRERQRARDLGVFDYLRKPFVVAQLVRAAAAALANDESARWREATQGE